MISTDARDRQPGIAQENIEAVARLQQQSVERRSILQKLSDTISSTAASESFVALHFVWFTAWIAVNTGLLPVRPFDPFPFSLLTMIVSLEAIFLTLFVLASQNRLKREATRRAHLDLQINLLAEQEMTVVLQMLKELCEKADVRKTIDSPKFADLLKRTDIHELSERVEESLGLAHGTDGAAEPNPEP